MNEQGNAAVKLLNDKLNKLVDRLQSANSEIVSIHSCIDRIKHPEPSPDSPMAALKDIPWDQKNLLEKLESLIDRAESMYYLALEASKRLNELV